jgi:acetate kinase
MPDALLVLNSGSSSIKLGLYQVAAQSEPALICRGLLDAHAAAPRLTIHDRGGQVLFDHQRGDGGVEGLLAALVDWIDTFLDGGRLLGVGHRVVHGGSRFHAPVQVTPQVLEEMAALTPLAPLHQPGGLAPMRILDRLRPALPQVACFDTAFHRDLAPPVSRFAIPLRFEAEGLRRYGFHGLSYTYIAGHLAQMGLSHRRSVVAHLGSGCSLCAMQHGRSVDTTMSLTALDGLVMGTRCGQLDPGVVLALQRLHGLSLEEVEQLLYYKSGLLGVSGISADIRTLLASEDPRAAEAIDIFVHRAAQGIATMAHALGGLEVLVFTAGVGENSAPIRARICERLQWLGVDLDATANEGGRTTISDKASAATVLVLKTDEEAVIVEGCRRVLAG